MDFSVVQFFLILAHLCVFSAFIPKTTAVECDTFGTCSQKCYVSAGDARCYCLQGFISQGNRSCVPQQSAWTLIYTTTSHIKYLNSDSRFPVALPTSSQPNHITNDVRNNVVYWTSSGGWNHQQAIYKSNLNRTLTGRAEVIVNAGVFSPQGTAYDWITGNLYFVDSRLRFIAVCKLGQFTNCAVIFENKAAQLSSIAIHPNEGIMFWIMWNNEYSIQTASMDGKRPITLVSGDLAYPKSITIDEGNSRIYWINDGTKIESCKFDGSQRERTRLSTWGFPDGIDIFGDMIFWSDDSYSKISIDNKFTGDQSREILTNDQAGEFMKHLNVMHLAKQPIIRTNPCESLNCPYVCVLSVSFAECMCPSGMIRTADENCIEDDTKPKILAAQKSSLLIVPLVNTIGLNNFQLTIIPSNIKDIKAMVYNPLNKTVIFADARKILEYNLETEKIDVLVENGISAVTAMEIDIIAENLIWIDAGKKTVEVLSLRTLQTGTLFRYVENARDILIVPEKGTFYVSKTGKTGSQEIHKINFGEQLNDTLFFNLTGFSKPMKLSYNREMEAIVLTSANKTHTMFHQQSTDDNGKQRTIILENSNLVSDLISVGNQIFFVDQTSEIKVITTDVDQNTNFILQKLRTKFNESRKSTDKIVLALIPGENDLEYLDHIISNHDCSPENIYKKACSHICLPTGNNMEGKCWCSVGFNLGEDGLNCVTEHDNSKKTTEVTDLPKTEVTDASSYSGIGYVVVGTVVITLCVVAFTLFGLYWWKYRSIPLITGPNISNL